MFAAPILAAFVLGTLPTAVLVGRWAGKDLLREGSGNPGATNTWRVVGRGPGLLVLALDGVKGWLAAGVVPAWFAPDAGWIAAASAAAAVLGHVFNPWLGFRGGKGVATSGGAILALAPRLLLVPLGLFVIVFALRRRVAEASIAAALALPAVALGYRLLPPPGRPGDEILVVSAALAALLLWSHRENLRRIRAGREPKLRV